MTANELRRSTFLEI